jgi:hypothetical protein
LIPPGDILTVCTLKETRRSNGKRDLILLPPTPAG